DTVLIHFEKADPNYKGAYQAINQMFLEHSNHPFSFVNREQDLGDPGLRKAKLSYVPAGFVHKFRVVIRES
ncbi:MAG: phosphatidylglycerol lysyltransferase domain-containing protein, partial [Desulfobacterales bacterium]|nr:phosphatidylglycerol lysyltransferase domain-containing protein [Desulfobacterales bacterium]